MPAFAWESRRRHKESIASECDDVNLAMLNDFRLVQGVSICISAVLRRAQINMAPWVLLHMG